MSWPSGPNGSSRNGTAAKPRVASPADASALRQLYRDVDCREPDSTFDVPGWFEHGGALLVDDGNGLILSAVRWRETDSGWLLDRVCTRPEARGMGFGRWIMTKIEALAIRYNIPSLRVPLADEELAGYYRRLGYRVEGGPDDELVASKRVGGVWQKKEQPQP